jgi:hypothetical protein
MTKTSDLLDRTTTNQTKSIKIWCGINIDVTPVVDCCVKLGDKLASAKMGERMLPGDDWAIEGYDGCDFRFPLAFGNTRAVNVRITGRTTTRRFGDEWVRVEIEWVGDCEPSTFAKGFMLLDEKTCVNGF